jgi:hypothetical protein
MQLFTNPFRPGAGQRPPYLAGRENEKDDFKKLLLQKPVMQNLILTGLRGVGKTVLLDELKPIATESGWFWAGSDLSESASVSENSLSIRILADLAGLTSSFVINEEYKSKIGFRATVEKIETKLDFHSLSFIHNTTPGLESDKLKKVLEVVWETVKHKVKGIVLAYDEAQILKDKATEKQYPLSVLLEVVQYLQKRDIPYLLVLTGLPTLYPNLIEARTYAERMFQVMTLTKLDDNATRDAILKPIPQNGDECPVTFSESGIAEIIKYSSGYPYFIQFFCRETFDLILQQIKLGVDFPRIEISDFVKKLDIDFYSGRWSRVTDRQRELLSVIAKLTTANDEFTVKDVAKKSEELNTNPFKSTHINNLLVKLIDSGLIYKNRRSKYSFAVPLLADYINRQQEDGLLNDEF